MVVPMRHPVPRQQFVQPLGGMAGDPGEHVGQPGTRVDVVQLGGLCRPPNYAERAGLSQELP